jgi:hypothetical protein
MCPVTGRTNFPDATLPWSHARKAVAKLDGATKRGMPLDQMFQHCFGTVSKGHRRSRRHVDLDLNVDADIALDGDVEVDSAG